MVTKRKRPGRPPRGSPGGKTSAFSTRITPELRKRLEQGRDASGHSLSDEIERRLWRTFEIDDGTAQLRADLDAERRQLHAEFDGERAKFEGAFGTGLNYSALRVIAEMMKNLETATGKSWADDPWCFDQLVLGIQRLMREWRPSGTAEKPVPMLPWRKLPDEFGEWLAEHQLAVLDLTSEHETGAHYSSVRIKQDLGALGTRRTFSDEHRIPDVAIPDDGHEADPFFEEHRIPPVAIPED